MQKNLDSFLPILLENAHRHLNQMLTQALAAEGMQPDFWRVLFVLGDEKGRTMGDLAESLGMNPPKVSKLMDKMVSKGLVLRNADGQDSRRVLAYITDKGLTTLERMSSPVENFEAQLEAKLGAASHKQLQKILIKLQKDFSS
ncbi:MarR family winged helix-turn-helix transcriptional regulator [Limnohabitans sp. DM1]|uniref:MarR family winged helix-turn-helix transcriptional regulator n=1 Tax=Limnohabitans sp. DM1 TaxID=1597955 RepID=UPI000A8929FA|nr:MarR family winged helix-turn-helix transcriptional regulator [Limnohabitans sp. DM1]